MDKASVDELTEADCLTLLRRFSVGRIAIAMPGTSPLVVPVNYVMDGHDIVFHTGAGQKLSHLEDQMVSFQIDEIDYFHRRGWSVLVRGMAIVSLDLTPDVGASESWTDTPKAHVVRLTPSSFSGRLLVMPAAPGSQRGYL